MSEFDKELEGIVELIKSSLISGDTLPYDLVLPMAVREIKQAVGQHVIGEDEKMYDSRAIVQRNGIKMSPRGFNTEIKHHNQLRHAQRQSLWGDKS